jgi:hypothetical protein
VSGRKKEGGLFERSEFASFSARSRKFKESFVASGAPFFAYFLWQDKESESAPAGDETRNAPPTNNHIDNSKETTNAAKPT